MSLSEYKLTSIKELGHFDVCVIGGGVTGVFAAIKAAAFGARTAIVEKGNCFGGVACAGLVNVWHTLYDIDYQNQIIAGLTQQAEERLQKRDAAILENTFSSDIRFDPNILKCILDEMVMEHKIKIFFHTSYAKIICDDHTLKYALVSNKDGLCAIRADFFIDATGDGDIMRDLDIESYKHGHMQPPTSCFFMHGKNNLPLAQLIHDHGEEFGLDDDWGWSSQIPGFENLTMRADYHIFDVDCSKADDLTRAEIEGRRKADAFVSMLRKYDNPKCRIAATCSQIGIRETNHYKTDFYATEKDILLGTQYEDVVMKGTYRVDIHHSFEHAITFKYLDGHYETIYGKGGKRTRGDWRKEMNLTGDYAKYYQVPFRILVQQKYPNLIPAGRMIHADEGAFGALRVMVNLNQLGEAAGVAAAMCLDSNKAVWEIDGREVRKKLIQTGSAL